MKHTLSIKLTVSRGRDTYGYNLLTLTDIETGKKYRTCGGGYDMLGTVFGKFLQQNYLEQIKRSCVPVDYDTPFESRENQRRESDYGFFTTGGKFWLDGTCGFSSMHDIAKKIGLNVKTTWNNRKKVNEWIFIEAAEQPKE